MQDDSTLISYIETKSLLQHVEHVFVSKCVVEESLGFKKFVADVWLSHFTTFGLYLDHRHTA